VKIRLAGTILASLISMFFSGPLLGQRADRAAITGLVTDATGASVAGAVVKVTNEGTNVEDTLTTNEAGAYSTPLLILGTYTVAVEQQGFKTFVRPGIQLLGGAVVRMGASLEVGDVTERVEVVAAAEMINTSQPEVLHTKSIKGARACIFLYED